MRNDARRNGTQPPKDFAHVDRARQRGQELVEGIDLIWSPLKPIHPRRPCPKPILLLVFAVRSESHVSYIIVETGVAESTSRGFLKVGKRAQRARS